MVIWGFGFNAYLYIYIPFEIQNMVNEYSDIIVVNLPNELPLVRSISHHIHLILGESLPYKVEYRRTPKDKK